MDENKPANAGGESVKRENATNKEDEGIQQSTAPIEAEQSGEVKVAEANPKNIKSEPNLKYKDGKEFCKGGVLGFFIGLAIIVPGVSGSAVAIIMKLYEKLLYALGNLFKKFKKCLLFLIPIGIGAAAGFILGFFGVYKLLNLMMFAIVALFAGLMIGAYPAIYDQIKGEKRTPTRMALFIAGVLVPIAISVISVFANDGTRSLENLQVYHYIIFLILGYAVSLTQLVPGLSATALLMMVGYYTPLLNSVMNWQTNPAVFAVYACLILGFVAGLLTISKGMSALLQRHKTATFYCVAGLSLGSIVTMFFNPEIYEVYCGWADGERFWLDLLVGAILLVVGIFAAYMLVRIERKKSLPLKS